MYFFYIFATRNSIMESLTIYKASAGSGKTYRLSRDYINLLLHDPTSYESILAVTFTNKATAEMKRRILMDLWSVTQDVKRSALERGNAREALHNLLDNYHFFRVQTIDTFFQTVLRNLARELQLNANLRVSLSNDEVVSEAVDDLIDSLANNARLRRVVMNYVMDSMHEGRKWNVISDIKEFGDTIFKELYKTNRHRLAEVFSDPDFFDNYQNTLRTLIKTIGTEYAEKAKEVLKAMTEADLNISDFTRKESGPMSYFLRLEKGLFYDEKELLKRTVEAAFNEPTKWYNKGDAGDTNLTTFVTDVILPAIKDIEKTRHNDAVLYKSAKVTLRHLNDMRLLAKIEDSAHNLNEAAQRFMLSDTQTLLHEIIGDDDAPFIFEKIGTRLKHVMIDEFQDTSIVQWKNFLTLLKECMSSHKESDPNLCNNLIVGDIKQSIYRFRSGDWRLLNSLEDSFVGQSKVEPLKTNWRSWKNIIKLNNVFLRYVVNAEINEIDDAQWKSDLIRAYADLEQEVAERNENTEGLVNIELLPKAQIEETPTKVYDIITNLVENKGARYGEIAILVRKKKQVSDIADYLEEKGIHVISAEAFRLDASKNVTTIVSAMKLLSHPDDDLSRAYLKQMTPTLLEAIDERRQELLQKTLHDLAESLLSMIICDEPAFVTAFFDSLENFSTDISPVLDDFIEAWDDKICGQTIETTSGDGITIMTIHKSKGLEFNHVIVPYCNWDGNPPHGTNLWVEPKVSPFSELPLVPVEYYTIDSLRGTIYEADGIEEYIQSVVDNFNLLYVAMTRPCKSLFVIGERDANKGFNRSRLMQTAIEIMSKEVPEIEKKKVYYSGIEDKDKPITLTYGMLENNSAQDKDSALSINNSLLKKNPFSQPEEEELVTTMPSYTPNINFRQSNESQRFSADDDGYELIRARLEGVEQHYIFSHINTLEDVPEEYAEYFSNEQVRSWYDPHWEVFNECAIITERGEYRPDRVIADSEHTIVIDFKFGSPHPGYISQVRRYMRLLTNMGYPDVQGYLWFVTASEPSERIVPIYLR